MLLFRCSRCHTVVWLSCDQPAFVNCTHCKQRYELAARSRRRSMEELHHRARGLAKELNIDFPSATSMVFGILKLPQVQDFLTGDAEIPTPETPTPETPKSSAWLVEIDPAFEPAIKSRSLTRLGALQRGNRDGYARQIVERHGISLEDVYRVADNKESLLAIIRRRGAAQPRKLSTPRRVPVGLLVAVGLAGVAWFSLSQVESKIRKGAEEVITQEAERAERDQAERIRIARQPPASPPTPAPVPEVFFDQQGRPTRISAPRPQAVLEAYCRRPALRPVALAEGMIPDKNLWFGVFVDDTEAHVTRAIVIRKERKGGHWVAGDGNSPIQVLKPKPERLGTRRELEALPSAITVAESR